jgi:hypothetical protein
LTAIELCSKIEELANEVGENELVLYALKLKEELKSAFIIARTDENKKVIPFTQTGQCMLVSAEVFNGGDQALAFENLVELLKADGVVKMGVLGYRKLFEVLAERGETALACRLLLTENYSGYYYYVKKGMSSMPESFLDYEDGSFVRKDGGRMLGLNHHWYGHILASIVKYIVGLRSFTKTKESLQISPFFVEEIDNISVVTEIDGKKVGVSWRKSKNTVKLKVKTSRSIVVADRIGAYRLAKEQNVRDGKWYLYVKE